MTLASIASAATTYLLYAMAAFPFAVWSGRIAHASMQARFAANGRARWPGWAASFFLAILPVAIILYFLLRGFQSAEAVALYGRDEWGEIFFLMVPPACGLIAGYGLAVMIARRG